MTSPRTQPLQSVSGLVLAGGRGERVGGADKGWLPYEGIPLIEHATQRLRPQVGSLLISANRNLERYRNLGIEVVTDDPRHGSFAGPLAGIHAALQIATTNWLVVVPCDAPHLAPDLVSRLAAQVGDRPAAVAQLLGKMQPVFCLVRRDLVDSVDAFLAGGERKMARWLRSVAAVTVAFPDPAAFANVNLPVDFRSPVS
jgi:molybdopterin-guanine dinucleotide biosynthesis protein A